MTARATIADALLRGRAARTAWSDFDLADMVIAAARAMPVEDQAELIGGGVQVRDRPGWRTPAPRDVRVVSAWKAER